MRQAAFDKAEAALTRAIELDPKFWNARFNLSEIPFLQKNWAEARKRFQSLLAANAEEIQPEAAQLIQYKILLTYILEGKKDMVDSVLPKLELEPKTPAASYAKAALAFQSEKPTEARELITEAEKGFSPQLNKLFAESLYAVGWMQKGAGEGRASLEITSAAEKAARAQRDARSRFEQAQQALNRGATDEALKLLDEVDPNEAKQASFLNLRGEVMLQRGEFDEAENLFNRALKADPKTREAQYNLAEIPLKKKEYAKARERLEALLATTPGGEKNQASQLIRFKIFLTLLLEGKDSRARKAMEQFQFTGDTPALYYAQAAWEFKQKNNKKADDWITSANKIYPAALNSVFAESFYHLGWLERQGGGEAVSVAQLSQAAPAASAEGAPNIEPSPIPGASVAQAETGPSSLELAQASAAPAILGMEATTAAVEVQNTPAPNEAFAQPSASISSAAPPATPAATAAPVVASEAPAVETTPATVLAPAQVEPMPGSRSLFAVGDESNRNLIVGGLVVAGLGILAWVLLPEIKRRRAVSGAAPDAEEVDEPDTRTFEQVSEGKNLVAGPPQMSLRLKASEPSVRRGVVGLGKGSRLTSNGDGHSYGNGNGHGNGSGREVEEPPPVSRLEEPIDFSDVEQGVSEVRPIEEETASEITSAPFVPEDEALAEEELEPAFVEAEPLFDNEKAEAELPSLAETDLVASQETPVNAEGAEEMKETLEMPAEPVGQGQPVPQLVPVIAEAAAPPVEARQTPSIEPPPIPEQKTEGFEELGTLRHVSEPAPSPTFTAPPPLPVYEPLVQQQTKHDIMPEQTQTPPAPPIRSATPAPTGVGAQQPAGSPQSAVQLTLSCEIASLQLTPSFKMGALQVRPTSKVVTMRLSPSQQPQPGMNLQVTFEIASIQPAGGTLGTVRLTPSQQQKPSLAGSPALNISGVQLVSNFETAPLQLMASQQGRAPVQLTATFHIATVEFSPSFEIAAIVLNSNSRSVNVQLGGASGAPDAAPSFDIANAQLGNSGELAMLTLNASTARRG
jgi:tetratricopeptide (TPR) repeat protein